MADATVSMYEGQPGTTTTLLYTNGTANPAVVKSIVMTNTTASPATITIGLSNAAAALAAANHIVSALSIPANGVVVLEPWRVLNAAGTIRGLQGTSAAITVHISGITQ